MAFGKRIKSDSPKVVPKVVLRGSELSEALAKKYGKVLSKRVEFLSTGCLVVDLTLGGGVPMGHTTEIYGPEHGGKTLFGNSMGKMAQLLGGVFNNIIGEPKYSYEFAESIGLSFHEDHYTEQRPTSLEMATDAIEMIIENFLPAEYPAVTFVDSVASFGSLQNGPKTGIGKAAVGMSMLMIAKKRVAAEATVWAEFFKRPTVKSLAQSRNVLLLSNQVRDNIGVLYGDTVTTPGGKSIKHYAALRLYITNDLKLGDDYIPGSTGSENVKGVFMKIKVIKNCNGPSHRSCIIPVFFSHGIDDALASVYYLQSRGALGYNMARFNIGGQKMSVIELWEAIRSDANLRNEINQVVRETFEQQFA